MSDDDRFCVHCGVRTEQYETGYFNPQTGLPVNRRHCVNLKCFVVCGREGHIYRSRLWLFRVFSHDDGPCSRCGFYCDW